MWNINQSNHRNKNNGHHAIGRVVWDLQKCRLNDDEMNEGGYNVLAFDVEWA